MSISNNLFISNQNHCTYNELNNFRRTKFSDTLFSDEKFYINNTRETYVESLETNQNVIKTELLELWIFLDFIFILRL